MKPSRLCINEGNNYILTDVEIRRLDMEGGEVVRWKVEGGEVVRWKVESREVESEFKERGKFTATCLSVQYIIILQ